MKCKYQKSYMNFKTRKADTFVCQENSLASGYCIFHDQTFCNNEQNKSLVRDRLNSKIIQAINSKEDLLCIGYYIPDIGISNKFCSDVYFTEATFMENISFKDSEFLENVNFSYSKFLTDGQIVFSSVKFSGNIVTFEGAEFVDSAPHFNGIEMTGNKKVSFALAKFHKGADFSNSEFSAKRIMFSRSEFYGNVHMNETKFFDFEYLYFNQIKFFKFDGRKVGNVNFINSNFKGEGRIDFSESEFFTSFSFSKVECTNHVSINFTKTKFHRGTAFSYSKFSDEVIFEGSNFNAETYFNFTLFECPHRVYFRTSNLSKVSFVNTDVSRVFFAEDVSFNLKSDKYKTLDERNFETNARSSNNLNYPKYGSVLRLYRNLRENFEFNLRYEDAGRCFLREMELRRLYEEDSNGRIVIKDRFKRNLFSITAIYNLLSKYGESLRRPTLVGVMVISIAFIFWLMQLNPLTLEPSIFDTRGFSQLFNQTQIRIAVERSFTDFIPFIQTGPKFISMADYVFKLMSFIVLGLALISLRRKFERRFRH